MNRYFGLHTLEGEWHTVLPRYLLLAQRVEGKRILDIGCGSGIGASLLKELGADVVDAIDHRPAVLELARMKHAKDGLEFHVMFWEELDFDDGAFDLVLCLDPSSPVTDPSLLEEVQRVLKPAGEYVCAIARKPIDGVEVLLPRYGYADAAENIDLHGGNERPPQVGELQNAFPRAAAVLQRPSLSYVFDVEGDESGETTVDNRLRHDEEDDASVAVWFCGPEDGPPPPRRTVRMPYYGLVNRLHQVMNELQMRQVRGHGDDSLFDEIVDNAAEDEPRERETTNEYRVVDLDGGESQMRDDLAEDDLPTNLRNGGSDGGDPHDTRDRLEAQLQELSALYQQVRHEFQNVVSDAQNALDERDRYIAHLVGQVQEWQDRYGPHGELLETGRHEPVPGGLSEDEMTTVYDAAEHGDDDLPTSEVDVVDDPEPAETSAGEESSAGDESLAVESSAGEESLAEESSAAEESAGAESSAAEDSDATDDADEQNDEGPTDDADSEEE